MEVSLLLPHHSLVSSPSASKGIGPQPFQFWWYFLTNLHLSPRPCSDTINEHFFAIWSHQMLSLDIIFDSPWNTHMHTYPDLVLPRYLWWWWSSLGAPATFCLMISCSKWIILFRNPLAIIFSTSYLYFQPAFLQKNIPSLPTEFIAHSLDCLKVSHSSLMLCAIFFQAYFFLCLF